MITKILDERKKSIIEIGKDEPNKVLKCEVKSVEGSVSQRACVFCGSRVVLYPIADALHIVHGPIGCASFTWDIRGAISTGPQLHRNSFSTDLRELDVIYGGEKKLYNTTFELIKKYSPKAVFIYSTCIVGLIGDDIESISKKLSRECGLPVISVFSEGFKGTKKDGYKAACEALFKLIEWDDNTTLVKDPLGINILGEFNIAGEADIVRKYFEKIGLNIISVMTGNGRVDEIKKSLRASLNIVQCSGSMIYLAKMIEKKYHIPYIRVSFFGLEDMSNSLYETAKFFGKEEIIKKTSNLIVEESNAILPQLFSIKRRLNGKKAALYVGGAFKAISLVKALRTIGVKTVLAGTQTGNSGDYEILKRICDEGTIIVDDSNPLELARYIKEKGADILIGGVKERPIAYKLGIGFCDHNHERKIPLAGFIGMLNFAKEIEGSILSPVFNFTFDKDTFAKEHYLR
ncbi:MAG: nitrogenase iron-molybdenum cofactor biosynthesis protein NifE [Chitinispirillaceae bacterium]|nr:nitrogenase iron-molybdenum cofactor biosynthesis protein NifE [Chitinispirillaceae bacterium]